MKPLQGIVVVSLEQAVAAPLATCRLADAGARVIKIERPEGDPARGYDRAARGQASYFAWANRGKESVVLDYKQPDDAALLHRLIARADVVVQNILPGALERAGFGSAALRALHPRLVTCDISGYGDAPEVAALKAYDLLVQCESGIVGVSGAPGAPGRVGVSICDIGAGMNAAFGILAALAQRERSGRGSGVAVSLFDGAAEWMTVPYLYERYAGGAPGPVGLRHPSIAPYGAFATADGHEVVISIQSDREWRRCCRDFLLQPALADDPRYATNIDRVANRPALDAMIAAVFATLPLAAAKARLAASNTAYGELRSVAGLVEHPALRTWPMPSVDGALEMVAPPVRTEWDDGCFAAAPALGAHTDAIRREFG